MPPAWIVRLKITRRNEVAGPCWQDASRACHLPGYRFPAEVIRHAVWLYHLFGLSLRDVELIRAERGVVVTHESIWQRCLRFGADFARKLRTRRPRPGDIWHMDEVFLRINGALHYLWCAVDQHGVVLDILVQARCRRRGTAAADI
jgi:putative transposase